MSTETITIEPPKHRNTVAVAMQKRYGGGVRIMKDRRTKRQNRKSWKKDLE